MFTLLTERCKPCSALFQSIPKVYTQSLLVGVALFAHIIARRATLALAR
jgi:hypothetical protein